MNIEMIFYMKEGNQMISIQKIFLHFHQVCYLQTSKKSRIYMYLLLFFFSC